MRLALLMIAVGITYPLFGFDPPYATTLTTRFPADIESYSNELEVRVHDLSGIVEGVAAIEDIDGANLAGEPWIEAQGVEDGPNDLRLIWMGGACLARIRIAVAAAGERLGVLVTEERSPGGMLGCMAVGVGRSLVLHLSRPIDPRSVTVRYPFG